MKNINYNYRKIKYAIIVFLIAFVPRMICTFLMDPVKVLMDEICTLNGAAYFAGLDWSNVVGEGSYYGFGFYALVSFIFKITDNPYIIYHLILLVLAVVQSLTSVFCFNILLKFFNIKEYRWCVIVSVICSYMVVSRAIAFVNEHPLILITWILVWLILLLCKYQSDKRKKAIYTLLLILFMTYSLLIHTRAITYWIAFLLLVILYGLVYRKCLISIPVFTGITIALVPLGQYFIKNYQSSIWDSTKAIVNASIDISATSQVLKAENLKAILDIVLGEINTIGVYTGGISYIAIVVCIYILFICLKEKKNNTEENNKLFAVIIFCNACVGISIAGMVTSWGNGVIYGLAKNITYDYYSYKALTYIRYFGPYLGPLLMITLIFAKKNRNEICCLCFWAILAMIPIQFYWLENIIPIITQNSTTNSAFMLFTLWNENKELESGVYYAGIMFMVLFLIMYKWCLSCKKEVVSLMLIGCILLSQYIYGVYALDTVWAKENFIQADSGYEWIKKLEKNVKLPEKIYVKDNVAVSHHKSYYIYQFMLNRYTVVPGEPGEEVEEAILFENTDINIPMLQNMEFKYLQLDENEYVFIKGDELLRELQNIGINLEG
ncbi:MAG: hypothetical protein HDR71_18465 [Lachnospiraceae bacterium]|nr:hypothetical protein [Lachnospiraceae bacterium]